MSEHGPFTFEEQRPGDSFYRLADNVEARVQELLAQIAGAVINLPDPELYNGLMGRIRMEWERDGAYIAIEIYTDDTAMIEVHGQWPYRQAKMNLAEGQGIPADCLKWFEEFAAR